jgi:hypothetical protein
MLASQHTYKLDRRCRSSCLRRDTCPPGHRSSHHSRQDHSSCSGNRESSLSMNRRDTSELNTRIGSARLGRCKSVCGGPLEERTASLGSGHDDDDVACIGRVQHGRHYLCCVPTTKRGGVRTLEARWCACVRVCACEYCTHEETANEQLLRCSSHQARPRHSRES